VKQADEAAMKNDLPGALDLLQQALAKDPNSGAAYSMLAKLYYPRARLTRQAKLSPRPSSSRRISRTSYTYEGRLRRNKGSSMRR